MRYTTKKLYFRKENDYILFCRVPQIFLAIPNFETAIVIKKKAFQFWREIWIQVVKKSYYSCKAKGAAFKAQIKAG